VAKPFRLLVDNQIRQPIVEALSHAGWDVVRAVDVFGERNEDEVIFDYAAAQGRVFLTNDKGIHAIAHRWLREGRAFRMVYWWGEHRRRMSDGEVVEAIEALTSRPEAFAYPIEYIKPRR
jgi:hypothetical protein